MEHKSRRPDILVDDELIFAFYDARVPEACTTAPTSKVAQGAERADAKLLFCGARTHAARGRRDHDRELPALDAVGPTGSRSNITSSRARPRMA